MKTKTLIVAILLFTAFARYAYAPQPAPSIDNCPLEVPRPFVTVASTNAETLLAKMSETLKAANFTLVPADPKEFSIEARNYYDKKHHPKDHDRVILWMARDVKDPQFVRMFFLFGRYVEVFGTTTKVSRIALESEEERELTSPLKQQLMEALTK